MREVILKKIAYFFRFLPSFPGKFRLGIFIQKIIIKKWHKPEFFIKLKNGSFIWIDVRSYTHTIPFWCGVYHAPFVNKVSNLFPPSAVVLDIGANIGYYAIPFASKLSKTGGIIHAFEPLLSNYNALSLAINKNNLKNIYTYKLALGEKIEESKIYLAEAGDTGNAIIFNENLKQERNFSNNETIQIKTLDSCYKQFSIERCDFIKLVIEGYEIYFLKGAKEFIKKYKPVICGKFSSYYFQKFGYSFQDVIHFCNEVEYKTYQQITRKDTAIKFQWVTEYKDNLLDLFLLIPSHYTDEDVKKWIN